MSILDSMQSAQKSPSNRPAKQLANKLQPTSLKDLGEQRQTATSTVTRAFKFGVVGCSGVVVNLVCTWAAYNFVFQTWGDTNRHGAAFLSGIAVSIVTNFLLNAGWTWRERRRADIRRSSQFLKFTAVAVAAAVIQFGIAMSLALGLNQAYLLAQTVGIGVASTLNFIANNAWTFRHRPNVCSDSSSSSASGDEPL